MTNVFDTHAHYASRQFDGDRADLLAALPRGGVVGVLECATHSGDAQKVLELAHTAPYFHAALGIHPEIEKQEWPRSLRKASSRKTPPPWPSTTAIGAPSSPPCVRCMRTPPLSR